MGNKRRLFKMKLSVVVGVIGSVKSQGPTGCYWAGSKSGEFVECLPDFYVKGACESGSRNDCNIDAGIIGTDASFGIKCCPSDRTLDFTNQDECLWLAADTGENLACGEERAAFGRCSTSARSGKGGDCNNTSHQAKCCNSKTQIDEDTCGWIYASYGVKKECPAGTAVAGFCGVNNKSDCKNNSFVGLRCCSPKTKGPGPGGY